MHCHHDLVNQIRRMRADHCSAEDLTGGFIYNKFHETICLAHHHGFAVVSERIAGRFECNSFFEEFLFGFANRGYLGFAKNPEQPQSMIDHFQGLFCPLDQTRGIPGCEFSLLNGDVDDFIRSHCIPGCKDVGNDRLLVIVGAEQPATLSRFLKIQSRQLGFAPKCVNDLFGLDGASFSLMLKRQLLHSVNTPRPQQLGLQEYANPVLLEGRYHRLGNIRIEFF